MKDSSAVLPSLALMLFRRGFCAKTPNNFADRYVKLFRFKAELGSVQQWYLTNSDPLLGHPMHIHVNNFQVSDKRILFVFKKSTTANTQLENVLKNSSVYL